MTRKIISQSDANDLVLNFMKLSKVCMTKKKIISKMMLPKTKTSLALTFLRKKKIVSIFRSGRGSHKRIYWGVV